MKARRILALALLTVTLTSCFWKKKPGEIVDTSPVTLEVHNNNWADIVIYAVVDGSRHRIGSVGAINKLTIELPIGVVRLPGHVELLLDPLGSRATFRTGAISVGFGNHIRLVVENELRLTSWSVQ